MAATVTTPRPASSTRGDGHASLTHSTTDRPRSGGGYLTVSSLPQEKEWPVQESQIVTGAPPANGTFTTLAPSAHQHLAGHTARRVGIGASGDLALADGLLRTHAGRRDGAVGTATNVGTETPIPTPTAVRGGYELDIGSTDSDPHPSPVAVSGQSRPRHPQLRPVPFLRPHPRRGRVLLGRQLWQGARQLDQHRDADRS